MLINRETGVKRYYHSYTVKSQDEKLYKEYEDLLIQREKEQVAKIIEAAKQITGTLSENYADSLPSPSVNNMDANINQNLAHTRKIGNVGDAALGVPKVGIVGDCAANSCTYPLSAWLTSPYTVGSHSASRKIRIIVATIIRSTRGRLLLQGVPSPKTVHRTVFGFTPCEAPDVIRGSAP